MPSTRLALIAVGLLLLGSLAPTATVAETDAPLADLQPADRITAGVYAQQESSDDSANDSRNVSEEAYVEEAPEKGDPYYEASSEHWISYDNPRDKYRSPYLGDGSGKLCTVLLNEEGDPIVGESIPNTTVTIPTGESLEWHPHADPVTVRYPLTDNYERPLDADQFGATSDLPQGDGYMDSHCVDWHGLPEDGSVSYGEARVDGEHADRVEVVGYVQQANVKGWETDIDPLTAAEPYDEAGGGWTHTTDASHGQVVVVLQLDPPENASTDDGSSTLDVDADGDGAANVTAEVGDASDENVTESTETDESGGATETESTAAATDEEAPGFGPVAALVSLLVAALVASRRRP